MSRTVVFRKAVALEGRGLSDGPFAQNSRAGVCDGNSKAHIRTVLWNLAAELEGTVSRE
jgi:hypothetical protein